MENPIEKLLDPKVSAEEKEAIKATLTPEQAVEFADKAKAAAAAELAALNGIRKEKNRVEILVEEGSKKVEEVKSTMSQFRSEQVQAAREKLLAKYKLDVAKMAEFDAEFAHFDSGKMTPEQIFKDMEKALVATDPDAFLAAKEAQQTMEAAAARATVAAAGSTSAPPAGGDPAKVAPEVADLARQANISEADAQAFLETGGKRDLE